MTAGKRFIIYFAIAAAACATVHFVANQSILNLVQQKIYQPAATKKLEERTDSFTTTVSQYINQQDSLFTLFSGNSVIRNSYKTALTDEEIAERSHFSASLLAETPGLKGIRIINANGKQLYYSTFSEDLTTHEAGAIKYTNYPKNTLPYSLIASEAGEKGKLTPELEQKRLIFSYPFYDADLEYRGTIAFYVDAANALRYLIPTDRLGSKTEIVLCNAGNSGLPFGLLFSVPQSAKNLCTDAAIESWEKPGEKIESVKVSSEDNSWVIFSKKCENIGFVSMVYPSESLEMPQKSQQYIIWATMFFICFVTFICWAAKTETERKKTRLLEEDVANKKKVEKLAATPMAEALKQQEKLKHSKDFAWNNGEPSENEEPAEKTGDERVENGHGLLNKAEQKNAPVLNEQEKAEKPLKFKQALTPNFDLAKPAETTSANTAENSANAEKNLETETNSPAADGKTETEKIKEEKLAQKQKAKEAKIAEKLKKKQDKAQEKARKEVAKIAANEAKKKKQEEQQKAKKAAKTVKTALTEKPAAAPAQKANAAAKAEKTEKESAAEKIAEPEKTEQNSQAQQATVVAADANASDAASVPATDTQEDAAQVALNEPVESTEPISGSIFEYSDNYSEDEGFTEIADYVLDDDDFKVYVSLEEPFESEQVYDTEKAETPENAETFDAFNMEEAAEKTETAEAPTQTMGTADFDVLNEDDDFADITLGDIDFDDEDTEQLEVTPIVLPAQPFEAAATSAGTEKTESAEETEKAKEEPAVNNAPAAEKTAPAAAKQIQPAKSHLASLFKERMEQNGGNAGTDALQNRETEPLRSALYTLELSKKAEKNYEFDNKSLSFAQKNDEHLVRAKQQSMAAAGGQKGDLPVQVTEAVMDRIEVQDEDYIEELEPLAEGEIYTSIFTVGSGMPLFQFGTSQRERTGRSNYAEAFEQASRTLKMAAYNEAVPDTIKENNGIFMINGIDETMPVKINYDFKRLVDSVLNV